MNFRTLFGAALAAGLIAAPAAAAHQPEERGRHGRVAGEIAREIEDAAAALGTVADAVGNSVDRFRYRGAERFAISRCAPRVERYGRMQVEQVSPYGRRSFRVYGRTEGGPTYFSGREHAPRAFACTVRDDGRVKVRTRRLA